MRKSDAVVATAAGCSHQIVGRYSLSLPMPELLTTMMPASYHNKVDLWDSSDCPGSDQMGGITWDGQPQAKGMG